MFPSSIFREARLLRIRIFAVSWLLMISMLLVPRHGQAGVFSQSWGTGDWWYAGELGNTDSDSAPEILCISKVGQRWGILNEVTGAVKKDFTSFNLDNSQCYPGDWDGDGRTDLVFYSHLNIVPQVFRAYRWNGSDYVPFISHSDSVAILYPQAYRTVGVKELVEFTNGPGEPDCDLRLRDLTGQVLFKASTNVPGWSGPCRAASFVDRNNDGIGELMIEDQTAIRAFNQYSGGFSVLWTRSGWNQAVELGNLDADPQAEFLVFNNADQHFGILDGLTGVVQQEFPAFHLDDSFPSTQDLDGDGRLELIVQKRPNGQPPVLTIHDWNGSSLVATSVVTALDPYANLGILQLRSTTQFEIIEVSSTDLLLRDLSGTLLFQASTSLSGWSPSPFTVDFHVVDADHFGMPDLILHDESNVRAIQFNGSFSQRWVVNGWRWLEEYGNADADANTELMLIKSTDGRFGLFDGVAGSLQQEFPTFTVDNSQYYHLNTDADPLDELYMGSTQGQPDQFTAFDSDGSIFVPLYSHSEEMGQWYPVQVRDDNQHEFMEADNTDLRVRDLTGTVIWRASTDLPGWSGDPSPIGVPAAMFPDWLGVRAFYVVSQNGLRLVLHHNTTDVPAVPAPGALRVLQNAPNPFRDATSFRFSTARDGEVVVRVYDANGRLVRQLKERVNAGEHSLRWDGRDDAGRLAPSGILFYEVTADGMKQTRKLIRVS